MTSPETTPPVGARLRDFLHPATLYAGIHASPRFLLPMLLLVASAALYLELATRIALPVIVPTLLDRSVVTESELLRTFRAALLLGAFIVPIAWIPVSAVGSGILLRCSGAKAPFNRLVSLVAYSALWIATGFLVKALLVKITGNPAPSTNLNAFLTPDSRALRVALAFTNPFTVLAAVWTVRGLRSWSIAPLPAILAGSAPWLVTAFLFAGFTGQGLLAPPPPVAIDDRPVIQAGPVALRHPPEFAERSESLARLLGDFSEKLADRFGFEVRPVRAYVYPDHVTLEQATNEKLHVLVTGSIRGADLVYLEMPGRNAAVPNERGVRNSLRYLGLMQLAPAAPAAPRWFVEGVVHAAAVPGTPALDREYREVLKRVGMPTYEMLLGDETFRTPEGPLLARSLVDHIAARYGRDKLETIVRDVVSGVGFRDALYAQTRLTSSALEADWRENVANMLRKSGVEFGPPTNPDAAAPPDGETP